ncbi:MAG: hypothetical protein LBS65_10890 [Desulfovibrio sp.]|jgi:tetratricopeptide (TPR) repeat protein|nr:hypothetical protein [Desulfovibrio sp.]
MTGKPVRAKAAAAQPDGLTNSLQSEVAAEASPLLRFITARARPLIAALALVIVSVAGYRLYAAQAEKQAAEEAENLGRILVISNPAMRLEQLEAYAAKAPSSSQTAVWLAIMETANQIPDHAKVLAAWEKAAPALKVQAAMGMAGALAAQEKYREAVDALERVAGELKGEEAGMVYSRIVILAELLGDYKRAVAACDALINQPGFPAGSEIWVQKKLELVEKSAQPLKDGAEKSP